MADLPKGSPIKSVEEPMMKEDASPKLDPVGMAPTKDGLTSGQHSDTHHEKGTADGSDGDITSPKSKPIQLSGDSNDIGTSGDDKAVEDGTQSQTEPQAKEKKRKKTKRKGAAARKGVTGFEGMSHA